MILNMFEDIIKHNYDNWFMKRNLLIVILFVLLYSSAEAGDFTDTLQIDEIIITGSRIEVARKNVPITLSTVSREEIELSNETAVLPVLSNRVPGMFVNERGVAGFGVGQGSAGQISMRGVGGSAPNTEVLVLVDGNPQFQGLFAHPFPDAYVSSDVEKVEVIRGPASIIYGSNAMAGAINIITKKQEKDGFSGNARASYGSFNTHKYMAGAGYKQDDFSIFASINYDRTDGHRENMEFNIVNGYVKAEYEMDENINIIADMSFADFISQDPGPEHDLEFFEIDIFRGKASVAVKNSHENFEGGLTGFYNFGVHDFSDGWVSKDYHAGISLYQNMELFNGNTITVGTDYKTVAGKANDGMAADHWIDIYDIAGYAYMKQILLENFIVSGGLRLENNSMFGNEIVPQAGLSYHLQNSTTLKSSLSKGFRSPSLMELFLFLPNPDLKPERLMNYEAGINHNFTEIDLTVEVVVFLIEGKNVIEVVLDENASPPMTRKNTGSFENMGFEVEANWTVSENLSFSSNYSFINTDKPRLTAPKHQLFFESTYNWGDLRGNLIIKQISDLYNFVEDNINKTVDYTLLNIMVSYRFTPHLGMFASGKNILNQKYSINYGYPMPGIHFMSGVNITF